MAIEVEQKFPLADRHALERQLAELGSHDAQTQTQVDTYFAHPNRDFPHRRGVSHPSRRRT